MTAKGGEDTVKTTAAPSRQEVYILFTDMTLWAKDNEVSVYEKTSVLFIIYFFYFLFSGFIIYNMRLQKFLMKQKNQSVQRFCFSELFDWLGCNFASCSSGKYTEI